MSLHPCVDTKEVLNLLSRRDPIREFVKVNRARPVLIDDFELLMSELLDAKSTRCTQVDHFAEAVDAAHEELARLILVEGASAVDIEGLEYHQHLVFELRVRLEDDKTN